RTYGTASTSTWCRIAVTIKRRRWPGYRPSARRPPTSARATSRGSSSPTRRATSSASSLRPDAEPPPPACRTGGKPLHVLLDFQTLSVAIGCEITSVIGRLGPATRLVTTGPGLRRRKINSWLSGNLGDGGLDEVIREQLGPSHPLARALDEFLT